MSQESVSEESSGENLRRIDTDLCGEKSLTSSSLSPSLSPSLSDIDLETVWSWHSENLRAACLNKPQVRLGVINGDQLIHSAS